MKNTLNSIENAVHFSVWTMACLYSLYELIRAQTEVLGGFKNLEYTLRDLNSGWRFLRKMKDESDVEWSTWKYLIRTAWFFILFQFFISETLRRSYIAALKYWYIISSVIFIVYYMGIKQLTIIILQPLIFWLIIFFGGKKISIWLTGIALLAGYNSLKYKYYFWYFMESESDEEVFVMLYAVAWVEIRCISFCLDYVDKEKKLESAENAKYVKLSASTQFVNMFSYVLYLPVLFVGPIIDYEAFENSFHVQNQNLASRLRRFIWNIALYVVYTLLLELAFHYIYFIAMQNNLKVYYSAMVFESAAITMLPSSALCGGGLWMGLEFHLKYVISYGTTTSFARLDNIDPPPTPRCIARIHVYSQMWRYFDVGLYRFLFKYIYTPVYNTMKYYVKMNKMIYKLLSSLVTFMFIFTWHGTTWSIFVWSILNYFGIVLEYTGKAIGKTKKYLQFKHNVLKTDAMETRFIAFLCTPLLGLSAISNFYLFAGTDIGNLYFGLFKSPSLVNCMLAYTALYCCCHVAIALKNVPSRTDLGVSEEDNKTVFHKHTD